MTTPVIFRKFIEGDVIALFPAMAGDNNPATCGSYQHICQHGAASVALFYSGTVPARYSEYRPFFNELVRQGYDDLRVYIRYQPRFTSERLNALKR